MNREEALKLLRGGPPGIREWNRRRQEREKIPSLRDANLREANLGAVDFHEADLSSADLFHAKLRDADLSNTNLFRADLRYAYLHGADLRRAGLTDAALRGANLREADLRQTNLYGVSLTETVLSEVNLAGSSFALTTLGAVDLSAARGLDEIVFRASCHLATDVLVCARGRLPDSFLQGCGLQKWEILAAKLYDTELSPDRFIDIQNEIFRLRHEGPLFIGGVFISYAHEDSKFVDKVAGRLKEAGSPVWLDRHDLLAGDVQKQIDRAIRLNDVVLLVLSKALIESDWVKHELRYARTKEIEEKRDILCPVALDDTWKAKTNDVVWEPVFDKLVLDFSKWKSKAFEPVFDKLVRGLSVNYDKRPAAPATPPPSAL